MHITGESHPMDLLPVAQKLLDVFVQDTHVLEYNEKENPNDTINFAIIECSDDVIFTVNNTPIPKEQGIYNITQAVKSALLLNIQKYK